jgi:hypothetical protein
MMILLPTLKEEKIYYSGRMRSSKLNGKTVAIASRGQVLALEMD